MTSELDLVDLEEYYQLSGLNATTFPELTKNPEDFSEAIRELHYTQVVSPSEEIEVKLIAKDIEQYLRDRILIDIPDNEFCCNQYEITYIVKLYNVLKNKSEFDVFNKREKYLMLIYLIYALKYSNRFSIAHYVNNILFTDPYFIREKNRNSAITFIFDLGTGNLNFGTRNLGELIMREIISGNFGQPKVVDPATPDTFTFARASASRQECKREDESCIVSGGNSKIGPNREAIKFYKRKSRKSRKFRKFRKSRKSRKSRKFKKV